jgi:hypothetical protein
VRGGEVERWRGGEVERCRGGEVERRRGGEVERWRGGGGVEEWRRVRQAQTRHSNSRFYHFTPAAHTQRLSTSLSLRLYTLISTTLHISIYLHTSPRLSEVSQVYVSSRR